MADTPIPAILGTLSGWLANINTTIGLINSRFASRPYVWANAAARTAQTGMTIGEYGYQTDTQVTYRAISSTTTEAWSSPWITWATAPTNVTVGTGGSASTSQKYRYVAGRLNVQCKYVLGTTGSSVTGQPSITIPVSVTQPIAGAADLDSSGNIYDVSATTVYRCRPRLVSATSFIISSYSAGSYGGITSSAPMTWAAGDVLQVEFWADPA